MANVFLTSPLMDENMKRGMAFGFLQNASQNQKHTIYGTTFGTSLIPTSCNFLLCDAINQRESLGITWFAMLHSDINPENWWIDKLIEEAEKHCADFMSAVVPIKNDDGITSTAIAKHDSEFGHFCHLTTGQVNCNNFPTTFGINEAVDGLNDLPFPFRIQNAPRTFLLCNTGCMVCRLDRPWFQTKPPRVWFDDLNGLEIDEATGDCRPKLLSEDWYFSRRIAEEGGKVMVTKAVKVGHYGQRLYRNDQSWGKPVSLG